MSATRDQSQKFTFVYSNLYHLYKKGHAAAKAADVPNPAQPVGIIRKTLKENTETRLPAIEETRGLETAKIIKARDARQDEEFKQGSESVRIERHEPPRLMGKRLQAHRGFQSQPMRSEAVEGLKENLKTLQGLHERLRFMLRELEDLVQPTGTGSSDKK